MTYRNAIRGCKTAAAAVFALLLVGDGTASLAADAGRIILRPVTPVQPAPGGNNGPQANTTPDIPPASAIPGTEAYELSQLRARVDALSEAVNGLRLQIGRHQQDVNARLEAQRRPFCSTDITLFNPVSLETENCSPYKCSGVAGLCRYTCRLTADCASGFVCAVRQGNGVCTEPNN